MVFLFLFLLSLLLLLPSFLLVAKTPAEARFTFTTWSSLNNIYFNCAGWDKEQRATRVSKKGTQKKSEGAIEGRNLEMDGHDGCIVIVHNRLNSQD